MTTVKRTSEYTDYTFTNEEFARKYMIGCVIKRNSKRTVVRVRGEIPDLRNVAVKRLRRRKT